MKSCLALLFIVFILGGCNKPKPQQEESFELKPASEGMTIVTRLYENSTTAVEYEIPVIKGTQIKHGIQKRYYQHGSLYSEIPYVAGNRVGIAYTYYPAAAKEEPIVWKEQPYVNNNLEGICKRYHRDGSLQAEYEYKNGLPAIGLKEYYQSGTQVKQPDLLLSKSRAGKYYLIKSRLSNNKKNVDYFIGDLIEGKYLPNNLKGLQVKNGTGEILLPLNTRKVTITAVMQTSYQNQYIASKTLSF